MPVSDPAPVAAGLASTTARRVVGIQRPNFHALMRKHGIRKGED